METLGLEVRRGYVVAAFAERGHRPVLIGDGRRTVIPYAVHGDRWGTAAAEHPDATWPTLEPPDEGLTSGDQMAFWGGLWARLRHFLGVGKGTLSRIPVVVAFAGHPKDVWGVEWAADGPRGNVTVVSPPAAAAHAVPPVGNAETVHRVVCVGDVSAEAGTFRVRPAGVKADGSEYTLAGVGSAYWAAAVVRQLDAVRPAYREWDRLRVWQSVLELAAALNRDPAGHRRPWTGAHAGDLVTEVTFSTTCLDRVVEHAHLLTWLDTVKAAGTVERTWTAGLGSVFPIDWPAGFEPLPDAAHAVAVGASLFAHRHAPTPVTVLPPVAAPPPPPPPHPTGASGMPDAPKLPYLPPYWDRLVGGKLLTTTRLAASR